jgi:hypothetical protein
MQGRGDVLYMGIARSVGCWRAHQECTAVMMLLPMLVAVVVMVTIFASCIQ